MDKEQLLDFVAEEYKPGIVKVNEEAIAKLEVGEPPTRTVSLKIPKLQDMRFPLLSDDPDIRHRAILYTLAMTSLQYRFWELDPETREFLRYTREGLIGSTALETAMFETFEKGAGAIEALIASEQGIKNALGENIPDPASRLQILQEVLSERGEYVVKLVDDHIQAGNPLDVHLAADVAELLPYAYGDTFVKKAMLFLSFLHSIADPKIKLDLCAFADYQVPSVLRHYGILEYSPELAEDVDNRRLIARNSDKEIAIRTATILACEKIASHFNTTAAAVDWWCFQQRKQPQKPFHLTETTAY